MVVVSACIQDGRESFLDGIYEPVKVAVPPRNAYNGLVELESGEIRHYGKPGFYIHSLDYGLTWDTVICDITKSYGRKSPLSGEFLRVYTGPRRGEVSVARSHGGIDGDWIHTRIDSNFAIMLRPVIWVNNKSRALTGFHTSRREGCGTYYSDDDGLSWKKSNLIQVPFHSPERFHKGYRWNHGGVEPVIVELRDGRLWMLIRNSLDNHWESFSDDFGESWSTPVPSRFYGTITNPNAGRLVDGRLLIIWNNTTPLPEMETATGNWEDVFTNRDALHAAISDDEGKTWIGFRELYLNPARNDSLFAVRGGKMGSNDRSVQQSEFIEPEPGKILVSLGQHPLCRSLVLFDVDWLYETERSEDFSKNLSGLSTFKYLKGIKGHCAYNRILGTEIIPDPENPDDKVLNVRVAKDTDLLYQNDGAVWNFPAGFNGILSFRLRFTERSNSVRFSLTDRWFNPIDTVAQYFSMFNLEISPYKKLSESVNLEINKWYLIELKWDIVEKDLCKVIIDGRETGLNLPLEFETVNGISYLHIISTSETNGSQGVLIDDIKAKVNYNN